MAERRSLDEKTVIERYFMRSGTHRGQARRDVRLGIGDDAAVTRLAAGYELVTATDALIEGVHFPGDTPPRALGHRCLAVNLSDLAAMGAEPLWATLALSLPRPETRWLREFSRGLFALADRYAVGLIGGDTVRGPLAMSVTVFGRVRPGRFVTRSGARAGDYLYVTGHPGDAVAGRLLLGRQEGSRGSARMRRRFLYPEPRVAEGAALVGIASAMMDVSDGLHDDIGKLLRASGCGADLDIERLPLSAPLRGFAGEREARELALGGGDDYELAFTVPPRRLASFEALSRSWSCTASCLGVISARRGLRWRLAGQGFSFRDRTFRHFGQARVGG